ncbi:DUF2306 domain-containing protein [Arthrobacter rhombi]|uniref:DUF2306 domain-containing protein n=1 Tax=Arthrobacter rhombi TaxID=71253 RepID=UPI003FD0C23F
MKPPTAQKSTPRRPSSRASFALIAVGILAVATTLYAVPHATTGNPDNSAIPLNADQALHYLTLAFHAVPAGLALVLGPLQFSKTLRIRFPRVHRITGRVYVISVVFAAMAAFIATGFSVSGFPVQVAFALLGAAWLYSLAQGFRTIRRGEVQLHRVWMTRNYALTFTAVTLRLFLVTGLGLRPVLGIDFFEVYTASAWASLFINVVVTEYFIVQRIIGPALRRRRREPVRRDPRPEPELARQP